MTNQNIQAAEILESAAMVIVTPGWWTKGALARIGTVQITSPCDPQSTCFCAAGALEEATKFLNLDRFYSLAIVKFIKILDGHYIAEFNDRIAKDAFEVASAMWQAAEELRNEIR